MWLLYRCVVGSGGGGGGDVDGCFEGGRMVGLCVQGPGGVNGVVLAANQSGSGQSDEALPSQRPTDQFHGPRVVGTA